MKRYTAQRENAVIIETDDYREAVRAAREGVHRAPTVIHDNWAHMSEDALWVQQMLSRGRSPYEILKKARYVPGRH